MLLTHPWGLQPVLGRVGSGRIAARRVGTVWAGASLVFHTPALLGQGVPGFIRAGGGEEKTSDVAKYHQADFPRLIWQCLWVLNVL